MNVSKVFNRIFSTEYMVRENLRRGDITPTGRAYRSALTIALPAVAEMVSVALMSMVNTMMVGKLGPYAVAAVGLTGQPRMIFLCFFFALNVGVTAIVSRRRGEGNRDDARLCVRQSLLLEICMALILSTLAVVLAGPMMFLAGANEDTLAPATGYFRIMSIGMIIQAMSMTICAAQRGVGNTRITMTVNIAANIVNVLLNFLLIEGRFGFPRLEVDGAAVATVIGYIVGFSLALRSLLKKDAYLRLSFKDSWRIDLSMLKLISRIGGSSMIEQVALRIGFFIYARVIADLGTNSFAAHQIAMQLLNISFTFGDGIAAATTALVGQNLGMKRPDLSIMYGNIGQRLSMIISSVLMVLFLSGRSIFPLFFTDEQSIINTTSGLIVLLAFIQPFQTSQIVMAGSLRGAGDTRYVALTMLITVTLIRPLTSILLVYVLRIGLIGAWIAILFDQIVRLAMLFTRFSRGRWINIRV